MGFFDKVERFIDDVLLLPDDVRVSLESADRALDAEDYAEAERLCLRVLGERPTLARAAVGLAHARHGLGDEVGTLAALVEARELVPEDGDLALWTARLAHSRGEDELALKSARAATRALVSSGGEKFADACAALAWAEWRRGRADRAARELRKALSADPTRHDLKVALVEALLDAGEVGPAHTASAGVAVDDVSPEEALRLGRALARAGAPERAWAFLRRAAEGSPAAHVDLARGWLARGELNDAEAHARRAVASGAGVEGLAALGEVLAARGALEDASDAYAAAAASVASTDDERAAELWRTAARTVPLDSLDALERTADALEAVRPDDPAARALRAWAALFGDADTNAGSDEPGRDAHADASGAAAQVDEPRFFLARAEGALRADDPASAIQALDGFETSRETRPYADVDAARAADTRRRALRALWTAGGDVDLAAAIDAVTRFAVEHDLQTVVADASRLRDELDRPLLMAVLGEFNAGKSTLINAFIGADVAPMGIVPTTATLNLLRGGAERMVRVIFRDGHTREGPYDQLKTWLRELEALGADARGAERVDQVEIVLPSETLERVWILDAPGTNALDADHESLAREAARRADAVMWVFDAAQAGKLSETKMHASLRAQGRVVVPVLNKTDRLREGELEEVSAVVSAGFGQEPIPISAKAALKSRLSGDDAAYEASGFPKLLEYLESAIFSQTRRLKRSACAGRLAATLGAALEQGLAELDGRAGEREVWATQREALVDLYGDLVIALDDSLRALERDLDRAFDDAAGEVLSFVRPRRNRFARHGVHPEDRAFLREVLERGVREAVEACEKRLRAQVRGVLAKTLEVEPETITSAIAPALSGFLGYQRGRLASGAIERFFDEGLPQAELERAAIATSLAPARADARAELRRPLEEAIMALHAALDAKLAARLEHSIENDSTQRTRVFAPLETLREVLSEIARDGSAGTLGGDASQAPEAG